jgi:HK97 family phage major capsid protein/HK97 family phage prohead protease
MKLKPQVRFAAIESALVDKEARTARLTFSSETPVERAFGDEVLVHGAKNVRMERINAGAPLLFNHNMDDVRGVVENASITDKRGHAVVRFARTAAGEEALNMVDDGILRNTSFMYRIHKAEEVRGSNEIRVTDWEPLEISLVTVPADHTVGVGRGVDNEEVEVSVEKADAEHPALQDAEPTSVAQATESIAAPAAIRSIQMTDVVTPAAGTNAEPQSALQLEEARKRAIINLCKANKLDERFERNWIASGTSLETVSDEILKVMETRGDNVAAAPTYLGMEKTEVQQWSLFRAINALVSGNWDKAGLELQASKAVQDKTGRAPENSRGLLVPMDVLARQLPIGAVRQMLMSRDLTAAQASAGGYLVETSNQGFVELLRNASVCFAMGATRLNGLQGNVTIPKRTGGATGYWLGTEATQITESGQTFGQISMTPKTVGAYNELSRQLLIQSSPSAEQLVMSGLAMDVGTAVDLAGLNGSGNSGQPLGLIGTSGIGSVTGASFDYADIVEFQTDVAAANALAGSLGYVTTPAIAGLCKARVKFTSTASPLWEGRLERGSMDGYPAMSSSQMPSGDMLFGDWSQMVIGEWGVLEIAVNQQANFQAAIIGVRALYSVDIAIRIPAAFSLMTSAT